MMRLGFVVAALLTLGACGGSSSETPPPLQPDPAGFHYAGVSAVRHEEASDAGEPASDGDSDDNKPKRPASSDPR